MKEYLEEMVVGLRACHCTAITSTPNAATDRICTVKPAFLHCECT